MRLCWMGIVIGSLVMAGCGPDIRATCEAEIACEGGNDLDIEACVASDEVNADYYADIGCGSEYDTYNTCIEPYLKCNEVNLGITCMTDADCFDGRCSGGTCMSSNYQVDADKRDLCEAERNAFGHCN
jgi:hypothetical protein